MKIFLDFDGTVVEHAFPKMGRVNFGCFEVIKKLQDAGHSIILNTYRADIGEKELESAIFVINNAFRFLKIRGDREFKIELSEVLQNKIHPPKFDMDDFIKNKEIFIDDMSYGVPLKPCIMERGVMVDWDVLDEIFKQYKLYEAV